VVDHGLKVVELTPRLTGFTPYATVTLPHLAGESAVVVSALVGDAAPGDTVAGVPAEYLVRAREVLAGADDIVVVLGRQSLADDAGHVAAAAAALHVADGAVRFLPALRRANVMGALDMGLAPGLLPGSVSLEDGREWYTAAWGSVPAQRGLDAVGICREAASGKVQGLILLGADPLADLPDRELARRALTGAGFVVAVDSFLTPSVEHADVVLPAAMYSERPGTTTNLEGRVTRLGQKIVPPGVAWPDWMIAVELTIALGADLGVETIDELFDEIVMLAPSHAGLTRSVLDARANRDGVVVPVATDASASSPAVSGDTGDMALQDEASGVRPIDPMSTPGVAAAEAHAVPVTAVAMDERVAERSDADGADEGDDGGASGPVVQAPPAVRRPAVLSGFTAPAAPLPKPDGYSLRLASARTLYDGGTLVAHSPHLAGLAPTASVRVHPSELARLGLSSGANVRVICARTTTTMTVEVDRSVPAGAAFVAWNGAGATTVAGDLIDASSPVTDIRLETL
jgi:NADH-quinone oxidoreductase subunit G